MTYSIHHDSTTFTGEGQSSFTVRIDKTSRTVELLYKESDACRTEHLCLLEPELARLIANTMLELADRLAKPQSVTDKFASVKALLVDGFKDISPDRREPLDNSNFIAAIKEYRRLSGAYLKDAKEAVEAMVADMSVPTLDQLLNNI